MLFLPRYKQLHIVREGVAERNGLKNQNDMKLLKQTSTDKCCLDKPVLFLQLHFLITKLTELVSLFLLYYIPHKSPELL